MRKFIASLALLTVFTANAQNRKNEVVVLDFTKNEFGIITYYDQVNENTSKSELFERADAWLNSFYPNPTSVIRDKDANKGEITGVGTFRIYEIDKKGNKLQQGLVSYTLKLNFTEGKYFYELSKFNWQQNSFYPIEKWEDKKNQYYTPLYDSFLIQTDEYSQDLVTKLKRAMATELK